MIFPTIFLNNTEISAFIPATPNNAEIVHEKTSKAKGTKYGNLHLAFKYLLPFEKKLIIKKTDNAKSNVKIGIPGIEINVTFVFRNILNAKQTIRLFLKSIKLYKTNTMAIK